MKKSVILSIVTLLCLFHQIGAQVSYGGKPLPLSFMRSAGTQLYKEMPSFDVREELRLDSLNESDLRSGFRFAYKFVTEYNRTNSGVSFTTADGTKVWRLGIYSPGALSVNVLFSEYELPEGAQLFLYNEDQTQILGSFNHLNNSELNLLPVAPIQGDRLVIEYQEPANVPFSGKLTVGEVNHAYRSLRGMEPGGDQGAITHIPPLACYQDGNVDYETWGRSVVLLIIDGSVACTATLVNNTENDGKPYLLTASHCLNYQFSIKNPDYEKVAGRIVCFFNYNSPFCDPIVRGTEEMSTASSSFRAVNEFGDMALLELLATPPVYYRPYYAGWNIAEAGPSPYVCIQHPQYSVKRISLANKELSFTTMYDPKMVFYEKAHWLVERWDVGHTAGGSSGAPLFNARGEVIGALSGGRSTYEDPVSDYFYSLMKTWDAIEESDKQLKFWLDPAGDNQEACEGLDPYASSPAFRLSNVGLSGNKESAECTLYPNSKVNPLFGNNSSGLTEYAEAYLNQEVVTVYGAYLVTPTAGENYKQLEVEVTVYGGDLKPSTLLYTETFQPSYTNRSILGDGFVETPKSLNRAQESFVQFSTPLSVTGNFFIGYRIKNAPDKTYFAAYNLLKGKTAKNTAWVQDKDGWKQANEYTPAGFSTSLFIDPVIRYGSFVSNEPIDTPNPISIYQGPARGTIHITLTEPAENTSYTLYSSQGKVLRGGIIKEIHSSLNFPELTSGIYFIKVNRGNIDYTQKLIF